MQLGGIFLKIADFLRMYAQYCGDYNSLLDNHVLCRKKYQSYDKFITAAENSETCGGLQLKDFLIMPVQRLCKYPLIFRELLETTPESHPDFDYVKKTLTKVNEIANHVNKITKTQNNFKSLTGFDDNVTGYPGKMVDEMQTREYIRDEVLSQIFPEESPKNREQKRHVYLFNDLLVLTKLQKKKKEIFKEMYNTNDITDVSQAPDVNEAIPQHSLIIKLKQNVELIFCCGASGALRNWMNDLKPQNKSKSSRNKSGRKKKKKDDTLKKRFIKINKRRR